MGKSFAEIRKASLERKPDDGDSGRGDHVTTGKAAEREMRAMEDEAQKGSPARKEGRPVTKRNQKKGKR